MKTQVANSSTKIRTNESQLGISTLNMARRFRSAALAAVLQSVLVFLVGGVGTSIAAAAQDKYTGALKNDPFSATVDLSDKGLTLPLMVESKGLPPGITAAAVPKKAEISISGTPTKTGVYQGTVTVTDSSKPPKQVEISGINLFVGGSRYRAKVEIFAVPLVPKPFVALYDSGSPHTILDKAAAMTAGLIDKDGKDNGFQAGNLGLGGFGGGALMLAFSRPVTVDAKGLEADGKTEFDKKFASAANRQVVYPVTGQTDPKFTLLGTDFLAGLGAGAGAGQFDDGTLTLLLKKGGAAPQQDGPDNLDNCEVTVPIGGLPPSWTLSPVGNTFIATGSPYTVVSQSAAQLLGMNVIGQIDLYNDDPTTFQALFLDGYLNNVDPGPITIIQASFYVPGTSVMFTDVPVLVNPFSEATNNVSGTDLLSLPSIDGSDSASAEMFLSSSGSILGLGCQGSPSN